MTLWLGTASNTQTKNYFTAVHSSIAPPLNMTPVLLREAAVGHGKDRKVRA